MNKAFLIIVGGFFCFQMPARAEDLKCEGKGGEVVKLLEIDGKPFAKIPKAIAEFSDNEYACVIFRSGESDEGKYADYACQSRWGQKLAMRAFQDSKSGVITLSLFRAPTDPSRPEALTPFFEASCDRL